MSNPEQGPNASADVPSESPVPPPARTRRTVGLCFGLGGLALLGILAAFLLSQDPSTLANTSANDNSTRHSPPLEMQLAVKLAEVHRRSLESGVEFTGSLMPLRLSRIAAQVEGIVASIPQTGSLEVEVDGRQYREALHLRLGEYVRKGDVLVKLDSADFEVALQSAEAKLAKAKAELDHLRAWKRPEEIQRLTADRDEAAARHEEAIKHHDRIQALVQRRAASQSDLDERIAAVATTRALLESAEADLRLAQAGPTREEVAVQTWMIAEAEAEVAQQRRRLEKATIRAPFDGVVTNIQVEEGDWVSPASGPILELLEVRYLIAEIGVPESFVRKIKMEDRAKVFLSGSQEPVTGMVIAVNEKVEHQTRTFRVRVAIDNAERKFKAGQFVRVSLAMSGGGESMVVPSQAIVFADGQPFVFVYREGEVHRELVSIGKATPQWTEILAGVEQGEMVVFDDPVLLSDGMKVTVTQPDQMAKHSKQPTESRQ
jgi:HlyD family secretion protein